MTVLGTNVLPEVQFGNVPLWRQMLRGFSQCAFQVNEFTALFFIAAATLFNWRMGVFYVVSVVLATVVAKALGGIGDLLDLGLYGFNSGLMGLALGNFFQPDGALWIWVPILAVVVAGVTVAMSKWLPFPFLAAPFILTFWAIWPLADLMGLSKIDLGAFADEDVLWAGATISALGSALFAATVASGLLFLAGVLVSSWRSAVVALFGAFIAVALATQADVAGASINSGFVGFNGVLAALAAYAVISKDLRLVLLASVLATWLFSYVNREWPAPALASGFVLAIWFILLLGWLNPRFVGVEDE